MMSPVHEVTCCCFSDRDVCNTVLTLRAAHRTRWFPWSLHCRRTRGFGWWKQNLLLDTRYGRVDESDDFCSSGEIGTFLSGENMSGITCLSLQKHSQTYSSISTWPPEMPKKSNILSQVVSRWLLFVRWSAFLQILSTSYWLATS